MCQVFLPVSSILIPLLRSFSLQNKAGNRKIIAMNKFLSSPSPTSEKKNDIWLLSYFTHRKKWSCTFFLRGQNNPSKGPESTLSSWHHQQIRRAGILLPICLGGMKGIFCLFCLGIGPHTIKRREAISICIYIYYLYVQFHFYFWIFMYFIYTHGSLTLHFCFWYLRLVYELASFNEGFSIISTKAQYLCWWTSRIHTQ